MSLLSPKVDLFFLTIFNSRTFEEETEDCIWVLKYDPFSDSGFRLYNPVHQCFLASSFRTFPDYDGEQSNDTIVTQLRLELEAACTTEVTDAASRMYILEGKIRIGSPCLFLFHRFDSNSLPVQE